MNWWRKLKARFNAWLDGPPDDPDEQPIYVHDPATGEMRFMGTRPRRH